MSARESQGDVYEPVAGADVSQGGSPSPVGRAPVLPAPGTPSRSAIGQSPSPSRSASQQSQIQGQSERSFGPSQGQSSVASPVQSPIGQSPISLTPIQLSPVQQYEAEALGAAASSAAPMAPAVAQAAKFVSFTPEAFHNGLMTGIANRSRSQFRALAEQLLEARVSRPVVENLLLPLKAAAMAPAPAEMQAQQGDCHSSMSGKALNRWAKAVLHATKPSKIDACNRLTAVALIDETRALVDEAVCNGCIDHHWRLKRRSKNLAKRAKDLERSACDTAALAPKRVVQKGMARTLKDRCVGVYHHWRLKGRSKNLAKRAKDLERSACDTAAPAPKRVVQKGMARTLKDRCVGVFEGGWARRVSKGWVGNSKRTTTP
jgi:hypothetical protein